MTLRLFERYLECLNHQAYVHRVVTLIMSLCLITTTITQRSDSTTVVGPATASSLREEVSKPSHLLKPGRENRLG